MFNVKQLKNINQLPELALCQLDSWDLISVTGEDRYKFLQGQLTCDLTKLQPGEQSLAAQCDAHGKVWTVNQVLVLPDRLLLLQPSSATEKQLPELQKYAVFSKVKIAKETQYQALGLLGSQSDNYVRQHLAQLTEDKASQLLEDGILVKQAYQTPGYLIIFKNKQAADFIEQAQTQAKLFDDSLWSAVNIAAGIPFIEKETAHTFIPQMLNLHRLDAISFSKGCYIGQETIARAKSRGINKRALFILSGHSTTVPKAGNTVQLELNNNLKRVGSIISGCQYADGYIELLAVLPKESQCDGTYRIQEVADCKLHLLPLPYSLENE